MTPVTCRTCGAGVLARKSSWSQTSVQWDGEATARCLERRAGQGERFTGCAALNDSLRAAATRGDLPVVDPTDLLDNPTGHDAGNELAQAFEEVLRGE